MVTVNKFGYIQGTSSVPKYWTNRSENDSALSTNTSNTYMNNETYDSCFGSSMKVQYASGSWRYYDQTYSQLNTLIEIKMRIWGTGTIMGRPMSSLQPSSYNPNYGIRYYAKSDTLVLSGTTLTFKHRISYRNNTSDYSGTDINVTFPSSFIGEWVKITMGYGYLEVENINTGVKYSSGSKQTSTSSWTSPSFGIGYYYFVGCIKNYLFNTAVADTVVKHDIEYIECYTWNGSAKTVKNHYTVDPTTGLFKDSITGNSTDTSGITGDAPLTLNETATVTKYVSSVYYNNNQIYKAYGGNTLIWQKS